MNPPRPRVWPLWVTPEFLVFLLAVVLATGLFVLQSEANQKGRILTDDFVVLRTRWTALVETTPPGEDALTMWKASRDTAGKALQALVGLEPRLGPVVNDLHALPLQVGSLKEFAEILSRFDRGLVVLEALRLRQAGAFQGGLAFTLLLGTVAFGLSLRRSVIQASSEARRSQQSAHRARIQEHERWRIARELHDGVAQDLARAKLSLQALDCRDCLRSGNSAAREDLAGALDLSLKEIRWICGTLRRVPGTLASLDLVIEKCIDDFQARYGLEVDFQRVTPFDRPWDAETLHEVSRMVVEGLTNVARHAGASRVVVRTLTVGTRAKVLVEDNGSGIDGPEGFGMQGIRERAALLGGQVQWDQPGEGGTRMTLTLPLPGGRE